MIFAHTLNRGSTASSMDPQAQLLIYLDGNILPCISQHGLVDLKHKTIHVISKHQETAYQHA